MGQSLGTSPGDAPSQESRRGSGVRLKEITSLIQGCHFTGKEWLEPDRLESLITVENVKASATFGSSFCSDEDVSRVVEHAPKAFAILRWGGFQDVIKDLLLEGFTDAHLPLTMTEVDGRLLSSKDEKVFWAFNNIPEEEQRERAIDDFLKRQYTVLAPIFDEVNNDDKRTLIYKINEKCALPLRMRNDSVAETEMSKVYGCELHPYHYRNQGRKVYGHPIQVAVKELGTNKTLFEKEVLNLFMIRQLDNSHLIKHIAACKVETAPPKYYVIFPLATGGDLYAYWKKEDDQLRKPDLVRWSLQQMVGLATAIHDLHTKFKGDLNCRHGDLKPLNILLFEANDNRRLVIADLGIAKFHDSPTDVRTQKATETLATTRAYEAPEAHELAREHNLPRPRAYDVWSLGCIMLEFTIWLLFNMKTVNSFASRRPTMWTGPHRLGGFYAIESDGTQVVCDEVKTAIAALKKDERCGEDTALGQLVRLIESKMLVGESKGRCDAAELVKELELILGEVDKNGDEFLLKSGEKMVSVPEIFRSSRRGSESGSVTQ